LQSSGPHSIFGLPLVFKITLPVYIIFVLSSLPCRAIVTDNSERFSGHSVGDSVPGQNFILCDRLIGTKRYREHHLIQL
jgi:hypothetical protein